MSRQRVERLRKHFGEMSKLKMNEERMAEVGSVEVLIPILLGSYSALVV